MGDTCPDVKKSSWPELLGVKGEVAAECINRENPGLNVAIVEEGNMVILDFRCDRVWVWVDKHGFVKQVPHIG